MEIKKSLKKKWDLTMEIRLPENIILPIFQQGDFISRTSVDFEEKELNFKIIKLEKEKPFQILANECFFFDLTIKNFFCFKKIISYLIEFPFIQLDIFKINKNNITFRAKNIGRAMINLYLESKIAILK